MKYLVGFLSYKELANTIEIFMQKTENFTQGDYNLNEPKNLANFILFINIISKHNTKYFWDNYGDQIKELVNSVVCTQSYIDQVIELDGLRSPLFQFIDFYRTFTGLWVLNSNSSDLLSENILNLFGQIPINGKMDKMQLMSTG